ncbi:MAG: hypothetical protein OXB84_01990 [Halobacteriovoraceae bacterium]|nr:hypothetical protein [Halobacteriovoraceae bacterium]
MLLKYFEKSVQRKISFRKETIILYFYWPFFIFLLFQWTLAFPVGISKKATATGFMDFNYYYDSRDFNSLTIKNMANITDQTQYYSFVNYSNSSGSDKNLDKTKFYTEQNIRWAVIKNFMPVDLTTQWVIRSWNHNDILRFGPRLRVSTTKWLKKFFKYMNMRYTINFYVVNLGGNDNYNWQMEHVYKIMLFPKTFNNRIYISGFFDHNFISTGDKIVTEHQIGFRIIDQLFIVSEYRLNEFFTSKKSGVGTGLEYKIIF